MTRKYKFTGETKDNLRRIRRLSDGLLGGWIEKESNLSHEGDCWVGDEATVQGNACVYGNAIVSEAAWVRGDVEVYGNAQVKHKARVSDTAKIYDDAFVGGSVGVFGGAIICGHAEIDEDAFVYGESRISGNAVVTDRAKIKDNVSISGNTWVGGDANLCDSAKVDDQARIGGLVWVGGNTKICGNDAINDNSQIGGDACISNKGDYLTISGWKYTATWTRSNNRITIKHVTKTFEEWMETSCLKDSILMERLLLLKNYFAEKHMEWKKINASISKCSLVWPE